MFGKTEKITLDIEGMMCNNCKKHVENAINGVKGVKKVEVSLENKTAEVEYAEGKVEAQALADAVTAAGYKATVK